MTTRGREHNNAEHPRDQAAGKAGGLMKKNVVILVAGVALVGAAAAMLWLDLRSERAQGSELAARIAALEAAPAMQATAPEAPGAAVPSAQANQIETAPPPAPSPATASAPAAVVPPAAGQTAAQPPAGLFEALATPQGAEMANNLMRGMMRQMYPDIGEEMGLSPQEVDAFFDLLARQQQEITADTFGLMSGNVQDPAARRDMQRRLQEKGRQHEAELAAHLGVRHAQWEDYQATAAARVQANELKTMLAGGAEPLSDQQYERLVAAFSTETKRLTAEERAWSQSAAAVDSPNMIQETLQRAMGAQRQMLDVAKPHLSAAQEAQFRRQVEQQMSMMQAMMGMSGGGQALQGPPPTPPAGAR